MKSFPKLQVGAFGTFGLNWAGWLAEGVNITGVTVKADSDGISLSDKIASGDLTTVKISALKKGDYRITFEPTTSDGTLEPRTAKLKVVEYKSV